MMGGSLESGEIRWRHKARRTAAMASANEGVLLPGYQVRERRSQAKHPTRAGPELIADRANMCWTWDIAS